MLKGFIKSKIKDVALVVSGATPKTERFEYWNGNILWITPNDLSKLNGIFFSDTERKITELGLSSCSAHLMPPGTIVMSSRAPIGYLAIGEKEFCTNQGCKSLLFKPIHDPLFFYYCLNSYVAKLKQLGEGTTFAEISKSYLEQFEIEYPKSKLEQTRIAQILSKADGAIAQTEALIAKYQRIKIGLMQDLLTKGIDEHGNIRSKETHRFVLKNGIEVPEGWEVKQLRDVCSKIQDGTHFSPIPSPDGEFMYLTSKNIRFGYLDLNDIEFISRKEHFDIYRRCSVKFGDVLLTKDGANTGNAAINTLKQEFSLLSSVCILRGKENILNNQFLLNLLLSNSGQKMIKDSMSGLAITRVTLKIINDFIITVPPFSEQIEISRKINQLDKYLIGLNEQLQKEKSVKTGLMQDLLSGKVRVKFSEQTPINSYAHL